MKKQNEITKLIEQAKAENITTPEISKLAEKGDPASIPFPRAWLAPNSLDFSFSGLKTAVANYVHHARRQNQKSKA